jgi:hypothetical protein
MLLDELPGSGYIYFEQRVDAVLPPIQVEVIVSVAPGGWDLYDAIDREVFGMRTRLLQSLVRPMWTPTSQGAGVRVGFILGWLQFELDVECRNPRRERDHWIQVEL